MRPLQLSCVAAGYLLYSVGLDETDQGGAESDDIGIRVPANSK
jgi:hypothetical protein